MNDRVYLDKLAAQRGQAIVEQNRDGGRQPEDVDNLVTKALGVLQENGIYACGLYLLSRTQDKEQQIASVVTQQMVELLAALPFQWGRPQARTGRGDEALLAYLSDEVAGDEKLERLLLAKETLEQMLTYARYGAKAWKATQPKGGAG